MRLDSSYYEISVRRFPSKYWHRAIITKLRELLADKFFVNPLLDMGSGDGIRVRAVFSNEVIIHGIDSDSEMVRSARKRLAMAWLGDIQSPPAEVYSHRYGAVILMESLEHVTYPTKVLQVAHDLLVPSGLLFVVVPIENLLFRIIWRIWTVTYGRHWRGTHKQHFRSPDQLFSLLSPWFVILSHATINLRCICVAVCRRKN